LLPRLGLAERDLKAQFLAPQAAADALRERRIDAYFEMAGIPSPTIAELVAAGVATLASIPPAASTALTRAQSMVERVAIPRGTYRGLEETATVSVGALWLVEASTDEASVYALTRALWNPANRRALDANPYGRFIKLDTALNGLTAPLHPGAARYYAEAGMAK
jgi:TRAP transporter TAXI family solute receptor